jgi:hypothetical protein
MLLDGVSNPIRYGDAMRSHNVAPDYSTAMSQTRRVVFDASLTCSLVSCTQGSGSCLVPS